jgi:glycosyltransferase involved in cell wall biosynthesis
MNSDITQQPETVPLSAVILTFNEELNLDRCLASVAGWCGDVHVVDSGSTDRTVEIAERYAAQVHVHAYVDHASQWEWVLRHVPLRHDWLLLLDADNLVTEELKTQVAQTLIANSDRHAGYFSVHRHLFRDREVHGLKLWWLRLVRRDSVEVDHSELVDFRLKVRGSTGYLAGAIIESNKKENNIDFWIDKHQRFSSRMAVEEILRRSGNLSWSFQPKLFGNPDERITWLKDRWYRLPLFLRPFLYFIFRYFIRMGIRDGWNGFIYHFLHAFWFRLLVDVKMADIYAAINRGETSLAALRQEFGHVFTSSGDSA